MDPCGRIGTLTGYPYGYFGWNGFGNLKVTEWLGQIYTNNW